MTDQLQGLLLNYIREHNPDLLHQLEADDGLHAWVLEKISEVELVLQNAKPLDIDQCMDMLTVDLAPTRHRYIRDLFEERFPLEHNRMLAAGTLSHEVLNMVGLCQHIFEKYPLQDESDNPQLDRLAVAVISDYLDKSVS